jgi:sugar lactone lactonase YvrE
MRYPAPINLMPNFDPTYVENVVAPYILSNRYRGDQPLLPMIDLAFSKEGALLPSIWGLLYDGWQPAGDEDGLTVFLYLSRDGSLYPLVDGVAPAGTRMNDAACDPQGRFWAGTKANDNHTGGGALYRLDHNGQTKLMLDGLTISNGLGWSPDGATMYLIDTIPGVIHAFSFDAERGTISGGRVLVTVAEEVGAPDGMTVDADGDLWVAIFGGGRVHCYSPEGELRQALFVPAKQSTSCAFAGVRLNRLYVTTATEDWSDEQRHAEPAAGLVYRFDTDATGQPAAPFRPDPTWWRHAIS